MRSRRQVLAALGGAGLAASVGFAPAFAADPQPVTLQGYAGDAMEPHITRDGRYLLFNNRNEPPQDTDLHFAERLDDLTFRYRGPIEGANSPALDAVATTDRAGEIFFVSTRSYPQTLSTLYRGRFSDGRVSGVGLVPGVSRREPGIVNFDVEVSADGATLYFVDARFARGQPQWARLVVADRQGDGFRRRADSDRLLAAVNASADLVYAACIAADGLTLYFTCASARAADGLPQIYRASRPGTGAAFGAPQRLPLAGFVEAPTLPPDEKSLYVHRRDGARYNLYRVRLT